MALLERLNKLSATKQDNDEYNKLVENILSIYDKLSHKERRDFGIFLIFRNRYPSIWNTISEAKADKIIDETLDD